MLRYLGFKLRYSCENNFPLLDIHLSTPASLKIIFHFESHQFILLNIIYIGFKSRNGWGNNFLSSIMFALFRNPSPRKGDRDCGGPHSPQIVATNQTKFLGSVRFISDKNFVFLGNKLRESLLANRASLSLALLGRAASSPYSRRAILK